MPHSDVRVYRHANGSVPLLDWLKFLESNEPRAYQKCLQRILLLSELGSELRRPHADTLRDGIHELRAKVGTVNYRMLYFFSGRNFAVISHGFTKEGKVPSEHIDAAIKHKKLVHADAQKHTAEWEI